MKNENKLTWSKSDGTWGLKNYDIQNVPRELYGAMCKLHDYEKTGLSPQQIVEMDKLYQEKCEELARFELIKTVTYAGQQVYVKKDSEVGKEG